jgi:CO/xanthine dehydrogenase FAD-binding subunit
LQDFDYVCAKDVAEVVTLLSRDGEHARILSGGTDLLSQLREGRRTANLIIDIKRIPSATQIIWDPHQGLTIGAAASCLKVCAHPEVIYHYPGLIDAAGLIGGVQIQGRASLGGNLCNASPAADSIPALIVHRAVCRIAGPAGERSLLVEDFCLSPGQTALQRGEFLVSLHLPPPGLGYGARYLRFIPRAEMDIAVAGAGAGIELEEDGRTIRSARLALGAVAPRPLFVAAAGDFLAGKPADAEHFAQAAELARQAAQPISDMRGTAVQRRHLCAVLARRALQGAAARAAGEHIPTEA